MKLFPLVLLGPLPSFSALIVKSSIRTTSPMTMKLGFGLWRSRHPSVLGLVGGIASGKSTVSRILEQECGFKIIDADKLGHESYLPGTRCFDNLVKEFGEGIISSEGTINRRALGEVVSSMIPDCCLPCGECINEAKTRHTRRRSRQSFEWINTPTRLLKFVFSSNVG